MVVSVLSVPRTRNADVGNPANLQTFLLILTSGNHLMAAHMQAHPAATQLQFCQRWHKYQMATSQSLLTVVEIILTMRGMNSVAPVKAIETDRLPVYALYNRAGEIKALMAGLIVAEFLTTNIASVLVTQNAIYKPGCHPTNLPMPLILTL